MLEESAGKIVPFLMKLPRFSDFSCVLESSDLLEPGQVLQKDNLMHSKGQKCQKSLKFYV